MVDTTPGSPPQGLVTSQRPYAPSLSDLLFDLIDRLPGHPWLFYAFLWLILMLVELVVNQTTVLSQPLYVVTLTAPFVLALMHWTDNLARAALEEFHPVMDCDDTMYASLAYRLTTTPAVYLLGGCVAGVLAGGIYYAVVPVPTRAAIFQISASELSTHYHHFIGIVDLAAAFVLIAFMRHKMQIMREILAKWANVNLFDLRRVYAFSRTTAFSAISLTVLVYLWLGSLTFLNQNTILILVLGGLLVNGAISFALPLVDTHQLLVTEKRRLLLDNARRTEAMTAELRRRIDGGDETLTGMDNVYKTLHSLEIEHTALQRVATWPWQPETARLVALAVFFPIALWVIQQILRRILVM